MVTMMMILKGQPASNFHGRAVGAVFFVCVFSSSSWMVVDTRLEYAFRICVELKHLCDVQGPGNDGNDENVTQRKVYMVYFCCFDFSVLHLTLSPNLIENLV